MQDKNYEWIFVQESSLFLGVYEGKVDRTCGGILVKSASLRLSKG